MRVILMKFERGNAISIPSFPDPSVVRSGHPLLQRQYRSCRCSLPLKEIHPGVIGVSHEVSCCDGRTSSEIAVIAVILCEFI